MQQCVSNIWDIDTRVRLNSKNYLRESPNVHDKQTNAQNIDFFLSFFFLKVKSWFTDITSTLNFLPQYSKQHLHTFNGKLLKTLSLIDLQFSPTAFQANTSPLKTGRHPWTSPGNVILSEQAWERVVLTRYSKHFPWTI